MTLVLQLLAIRNSQRAPTKPDAKAADLTSAGLQLKMFGVSLSMLSSFNSCRGLILTRAPRSLQTSGSAGGMKGNRRASRTATDMFFTVAQLAVVHVYFPGLSAVDPLLKLDFNQAAAIRKSRTKNDGIHNHDVAHGDLS